MRIKKILRFHSLSKRKEYPFGIRYNIRKTRKNISDCFEVLELFIRKIITFRLTGIHERKLFFVKPTISNGFDSAMQMSICLFLNKQ
jgi:hypothetical protein